MVKSMASQNPSPTATRMAIRSFRGLTSSVAIGMAAHVVYRYVIDLSVNWLEAYGVFEFTTDEKMSQVTRKLAFNI